MGVQCMQTCLNARILLSGHTKNIATLQLLKSIWNGNVVESVHFMSAYKAISEKLAKKPT